jgi:two-component system sensor histidine kinase KdpD
VEQSPRARIWALYIGAWLLATVVFDRVSDNPDVRIAHGVLTYLLLIIGASRQGGRWLSVVMVLSSYVAVDYFFVPPRREIGGASELNALILVGFVLTGVLITAMFDQLQRAVSVARERTAEVERLSAERLQLERDAATARVLTEADRLKNALLGSIAHDLRSPVATLALLADPAGGFGPSQALQRVGEEARRLGEYLGTLQRFANTSGPALQLEAYDLGALVQVALRSGEAMLAKRTVRVHAPRRETLAWCDRTLTVQVLGNLLQNAARYSAPETSIDVFCTSTPDALEIVVADRGPGLAGSDVERLFMPLRRKPAPWSEPVTEAARMGMGLSIARTFARAQGGDVLYRDREGGGSCFALRLPKPLSDSPTATT